MSTMQLEPHNAVAAAEATATVETGVEEMDRYEKERRDDADHRSASQIQ